MASNNIIYLPGQPVQFYKVSPSASELASGQRQFSNTAYDQRRGTCYFVSPEYCHPVSRLDDAFTFQFKAQTTGSELMNVAFASLEAGSNTSVVADYLVDAGATFLSNGAQLNYLVTNTSDNLSSQIIDLTSETQLELDDDIFTATPRNYRVYPIEVLGGWRYNETGTYFYISNAISGATITFPTLIGTGLWYKLTIELRNVTAGSLKVKFGTNLVATLNSNGEHIVYGQCSGSTDFVLETSVDFTGNVMGETYMNMYQLETDYQITFYDMSNNVVDSFQHNETTDALTIGNIFVFGNYADYITECGSYRIGISTDTICPGDSIQNGDFADGDTGWSLSGSSIVNEQLEFNDAAAGAYASNGITCNIVEGHSYIMTWDVRDVSEIGETTEGSYGIYAYAGPPTQISPSYNPAPQVGTTVTLPFTATQNSTYVAFFTLGVNNTFAIDNVTLTDVTEIAIDDNDGLSECLCICDAECTMLIKYSADSPTLGSYFGSDLGGNNAMYFRLPGGVLRNFTPNMISYQPFNSTQSNMVQPYNKNQREEELACLPMPEWAHETLACILQHPVIYLNGVQYESVSIAAPDWNDDMWLATVIHRVAMYNQKYRENTY